jgi:hypothetical protein
MGHLRSHKIKLRIFIEAASSQAWDRSGGVMQHFSMTFCPRLRSMIQRGPKFSEVCTQTGLLGDPILERSLPLAVDLLAKRSRTSAEALNQCQS